MSTPVYDALAQRIQAIADELTTETAVETETHGPFTDAIARAAWAYGYVVSAAAYRIASLEVRASAAHAGAPGARPVATPPGPGAHHPTVRPLRGRDAP